MISQEHLPFEQLAAKVEEGELELSFPLEYTIKEIQKIKKRLPKSYDKVAQLLAMSRPVVELVFHRMNYQEPSRPAHSRGRPRMSEKSLLLIHFLAQTFIADGYRQTERELNSHPNWLKALNLEKSPDHTTLSKFRTRKGPEFFDEFFHELTALLFEFDLIKEGDDAIVDSAPVEASQNFARSNANIKIKKERVKRFFDAVDFSPAVQLIAPACNRGRKRKYANETILKFVAFEKLCGFLSRSQALKHLKKHPETAEIIGFAQNDVPSSSLISTYLNRIPPIPWLMRVMVDPITDFFAAQPEYDDRDPLSFFFRSV
jgi:hypothetical protein